MARRLTLEERIQGHLGSVEVLDRHSDDEPVYVSEIRRVCLDLVRNHVDAKFSLGDVITLVNGLTVDRPKHTNGHLSAFVLGSFVEELVSKVDGALSPEDAEGLIVAFDAAEHRLAQGSDFRPGAYIVKVCEILTLPELITDFKTQLLQAGFIRELPD